MFLLFFNENTHFNSVFRILEYFESCTYSLYQKYLMFRQVGRIHTGVPRKMLFHYSAHKIFKYLFKKL